jgi:hypothetical protein
MLVLVTSLDPLAAHAEIASLCLEEALEAEGGYFDHLIAAATSHIEDFRLALTKSSPENAWLTYQELVSSLELFAGIDQAIPGF